MLKSAARKILWMARGAAMFGGLAVTVALVFGAASVALAAVPGDPFRLGQTNTISNALTRIEGFRAGGSILTVDNDSSAGGSRALDLRVEPNKPPMNVNPDAGTATNLDADELDGLSAEEVGVNGLEVVTEDSATNSDSPKTAIADCPEGKVLVGTGYELIGGTSGPSRDIQTDVAVTDADPSTFSGQVEVTAFEERPTTADWLVRASAICATEGTP